MLYFASVFLKVDARAKVCFCHSGVRLQGFTNIWAPLAIEKIWDFIQHWTKKKVFQMYITYIIRRKWNWKVQHEFLQSWHMSELHVDQKAVMSPICLPILVICLNGLPSIRIIDLSIACIFCFPNTGHLIIQ